MNIFTIKKKKELHQHIIKKNVSWSNHEKPKYKSNSWENSISIKRNNASITILSQAISTICGRGSKQKNKFRL